MKALVTGGAGFLGTRIVQQLVARGADVTVCSRQASTRIASASARALDVDLREADAVYNAVRGNEVVFHVAAKAGVWGRWKDYYEANVIATRNVLAACHRHGVKRLIYTSTPSVVFEEGLPEGADESAPYPRRFLTHYAHTKAIAEQEVLAANGVEGLLACALRPHLIWGSGDPHLLPRVLARARAGKLKQVGDGQNRVDITHVMDAARAHLNALDHLEGAAGKAYFIASETVLLWPWINEVLRRAGMEPVVGSVSEAVAIRVGALLESIWRALWLRGEPPMTRFVAMNLARPHWFSIEAAKRDLGYAPAWTGDRALDEFFATERVAVAA